MTTQVEIRRELPETRSQPTGSGKWRPQMCSRQGRHEPSSGKNRTWQGAWGAQSVKHPALEFGSGHDLAVHEMEPRIGSVLTAWSLPEIHSFVFSLSLSLCASSTYTRSLKKKNIPAKGNKMTYAYILGRGPLSTHHRLGLGVSGPLPSSRWQNRELTPCGVLENCTFPT